MGILSQSMVKKFWLTLRARSPCCMFRCQGQTSIRCCVQPPNPTPPQLLDQAGSDDRTHHRYNFFPFTPEMWRTLKGWDWSHKYLRVLQIRKGVEVSSRSMVEAEMASKGVLLNCPGLTSETCHGQQPLFFNWLNCNWFLKNQMFTSNVYGHACWCLEKTLPYCFVLVSSKPNQQHILMLWANKPPTSESGVQKACEALLNARISPTASLPNPCTNARSSRITSNLSERQFAFQGILEFCNDVSRNIFRDNICARICICIF